jgi:hypothetical protein
LTDALLDGRFADGRLRLDEISESNAFKFFFYEEEELKF